MNLKLVWESEMIATNSDIVRMFGLPRETFDATLTLKPNESPTWEIKAYAEVKKNKTLWINIYRDSATVYHSEQEANLNANPNRLYGRAYPVEVEE